MTMPFSAHTLLYLALGGACPLLSCFFAHFVPECTLYSIILRTIISDEDNNENDNNEQIGVMITPESLMAITSLHVNVKTPIRLLSRYF